MWNKKPTRCYIVLYLFLLYKLLNMFRATLCPSSGADDLVVFLPRVVQCRGCVGCQIRLAGCVSTGKYVAGSTLLRTPKWTHNQPTGSDRLHSHRTTQHAAKIPLSRQLLKMGTRWPETCWATYKEQLIRRNKYNTKWHLVGFLFCIELRCTVNHTSNSFYLRYRVTFLLTLFLPKRNKDLRRRTLTYLDHTHFLHTHTHTNPVDVPWTSDQPDAEASTW